MKFIRVLKAENDIELIFKEEVPILIKKLNEKLKEIGINGFYHMPRSNKVWFSDGYFMTPKFYMRDRNDNSDFNINELNNISTENLIFKTNNETGRDNSIFLKESYRPTSHRGQHPNIDEWTDEDWLKTGL